MIRLLLRKIYDRLLRFVPTRLGWVLAVGLLFFAGLPVAHAAPVDHITPFREWLALELENAENRSLRNTLRQTDSLLAMGEYALAMASGAEILDNGELRETAKQTAGLMMGMILCDELSFFDQGKIYLQEALAGISEKEQPRIYLEVLDKLVKCKYRLYESKETIRLAVRGFEIASEYGLPEYALSFTQWVGRAHEIEGKWEKALEYYEKVFRQAEASGEPMDLYNAHLNVAVTKYKSGDAKGGLKRMQSCQLIAENMEKNPRLLADIQLWMGIMHRELGDFERALDLLSQAKPIFDQLGILYRRTHVRMEIARTWLHKGDSEEVIPVVLEARDVAGDQLTDYDAQFSSDLLFYAYQDLGNYEEAIKWLIQRTQTQTRLDSINDSREMIRLTQDFAAREERLIIDQQAEELRGNRREKAMLIAGLLIFGAALMVLWYLLRKWKEAKNRAESMAEKLGGVNEELKASLDYQRVLRSELHHRVKNNLQLIISLLDLQEMGAKERAPEELFEALKERVYSISAVHQLLDAEGGGVDVSLVTYARHICEYFIASWNGDQAARIELSTVNHRFKLDTLIPLGLILNELFTNSRKYARVEGQPLEIVVALSEDGEGYLLKFRDNGPGFRTNNQAVVGSGLGNYLIDSLSRQLEGTVERTNDKGSVCRIRFMPKNQDKEVVSTELVRCRLSSQRTSEVIR